MWRRFMGGEGERRLGRFLEDKPRAAYRLSSKVGWRVVEGQCVFDCSHDGVRRTVDDSLARLGVERLDTVFIHDIDPSNHGADQPRIFAEAMTGALPALLALREEGVGRDRRRRERSRGLPRGPRAWSLRCLLLDCPDGTRCSISAHSMRCCRPALCAACA